MNVRLPKLLLILAWAAAAACASSGAVPRPFPSPAAPPAASRSPSRAEAAAAPVTAEAASAPLAAEAAPLSSAVVGTALALRGVPYRSGGSDPAGFDCSGFVWYVFARNGIAIPRTVAAQFQVGRPIRDSDLRAGDLVFFQTGGAPASHVGMVIGDGQFVHAPSSRGEVRIERLATPYWSSRFVGARRLS
jgi:cell wall-associated NlpC family hydrolase